MSATSIYDFTAQRIDGTDAPLRAYEGQVLLIVNTASKCGFTPQYDGLQALHDKYAERGLKILGFPCNQFGKQEPGDASQIQEFCSLNFRCSSTCSTRSRSTAATPIPCSST